MLINMVLPGAVAEEPFAFEYSGNFTDNRDADGKGTVRLNTSGTLTVLSGKATVSAYILGGGGGGAWYQYSTTIGYAACGGSGGIQTVAVTLEPGTYEIVIGIGGSGASGVSGTYTGTNGGDTSAFGVTSTGGTGGSSGYSSSTAGTGGTPNGTAGTTNRSLSNSGSIAGGSPNGGGVVNGVAQPGGDGYVELTFI